MREGKGEQRDGPRQNFGEEDSVKGDGSLPTFYFRKSLKSDFLANFFEVLSKYFCDKCNILYL